MRKLKVGSVFKVKGKRYAFSDFTSRGLVICYDLRTRKMVKFNGNLTYERLQDSLTGEISQDGLEQIRLAKQKEIHNRMLINKIEEGQKFLGNDNKEYTFVELRRTRFVMKDFLGNQYTAKPGFIKKLI